MKPDTERMMRAYLEIYGDFEEIYRSYIHRQTNNDFLEISKLFEIAWNDSLLGELLRKEVLERYHQLMQAEQVKREIEEEAQAGEAMII